MITYIKQGLNEVGVKLDKKIVGTIKRGEEGWQYFPKGHKKGGEVFKQLSHCKYSLEDH